MKDCLPDLWDQVEKRIGRELRFPEVQPLAPTRTDLTSVASVLEWLAPSLDFGHHLTPALLSGQVGLGSPLEHPERTQEENPYLVAIGAILSAISGKLYPASPENPLPNGLHAKSFKVPWRRRIDQEQLASATTEFFKGKSVREITSLYFDLEELQVYVRLREAMMAALEIHRPGFSQHFSELDSYKAVGGFLGNAVIKLGPGKVALVSFGDGGVGYAVGGKLCYFSKPTCIDKKGKINDYFGYQPSNLSRMEERIPDEISIKILSGPELTDAVIFGYSDGWLWPATQKKAFYDAIMASSGSVPALMAAIRETRNYLYRYRIRVELMIEVFLR